MKRKALWALIGVFLFGMLCGVFLDRAFLGFRGWGPWGGRGDHEKKQSRLLKILSWKLDLTDAQKAQIAPVLRSTWVELEGVRRDAFNRVDQVLARSADQIRPVLNPEQSEKFEGLLKRFREKRHRGGRGRRRWWKRGKLDGVPGFPDCLAMGPIAASRRV